MEEMLLNIVKKTYRTTSNPKTVFIPYGVNESELPIAVKKLRDKFGYMLQIEII